MCLTASFLATELAVRHTKLVCLTASFLSTDGFNEVLIISKCMHGLQACLLRYITVAAFRIYAQRGEDAADRGGRNSHGNYIVKKSWNCVIEFLWKLYILLIKPTGQDRSCFSIISTCYIVFNSSIKIKENKKKIHQ